MLYFTYLLIGYLFGSIPFALVIARSCGVDIFKAGSGNPGATNVMRSVGKWQGRLCFALDALKGFIPVLFLGLLTHSVSPAAVALIGTIIGHSFPVWTKFRGGKGVATTIGGLFALEPLVMFVGVIVWLVVFFISRYVSLASILMAVWLPFGAWLFRSSTLCLIIMSLLGALVVVRHRANIERLLKGTENRFGKK